MIDESEAAEATIDIDRAIAALGVALLSTAVVVSAWYSSAADRLDWSHFLVGLTATAGLLGIATALLGGASEDDDLSAWSGASGALATGLMIAVGLDAGGVDFY